MEVVLIIAVAALFVLLAVVSLKGRGARQATRKHEQGEAHVAAEKGKAQQERSSARQAEVRATHAERASAAGTETDE